MLETGEAENTVAAQPLRLGASTGQSGAEGLKIPGTAGLPWKLEETEFHVSKGM